MRIATATRGVSNQENVSLSITGNHFSEMQYDKLSTLDDRHLFMADTR